MGYRRMTVEHVYEILRRWHSGQSVSRISVAEECDRKTVRKYIQKFMEKDKKPLRSRNLCIDNVLIMNCTLNPDQCL